MNYVSPFQVLCREMCQPVQLLHDAPKMTPAEIKAYLLAQGKARVK